MSYSNALVIAMLKKSVGIVISLLSLLLMTVSLLKAYISQLMPSDVSQNTLAHLLNQIATLLARGEGLTAWIWRQCPIPNLETIFVEENSIFLGLYLLIFVGIALYKSGKELSSQVREANKQIRLQLLKETMDEGKSSSREEVEEATRVAGSSLFQQIHHLYLAPVITAIIVTLIVKLIGL